MPDYIYGGVKKVYNPAMEFLPKSVKEAIKSVSEKLQISETVIMAILDFEYEKRNKENEGKRCE